MRADMDAHEIIEALGGREEVSSATGAAVPTIIQWEWRGRIPQRHIPSVSALAKRKPGSGVTLEMLTELGANPSPRQALRPRTSEQAA